MIYILSAVLIALALVAICTMVHNERRHAAQREIQRAKWRERFEEVTHAR